MLRLIPGIRDARTFLPAACAVLLLAACDSSVEPDPTSSSFARLQSEVFDAGCVGCHFSGGSYATQSGLVLEPGSAYESLVGVQPHDADARADGFLRVAPGDPDRSLLLHKLRWDHAPTQTSYGAPMPLGGTPLSVGQVEFVREWIEAGAPRQGQVVNVALLDDATPQDVTAFLPLAPPEHGFQLHVGPFAVPPQRERELFRYVPLGNPEEIWVNRVEISMRPNSHHFVLYHFRDGTPPNQIPPQNVMRDIWNPDGSFNPSALAGMTWRQRIAGAQTADAASLFPDGVAVRLPANVSIDLNSHYLNRTDDVLYGEVYANLHTVDPASVTYEARALFLNNTQLEIPPHAPGETTVVARDFVFDGPRKVFTLTSHMHEKGLQFVIRRLDAGVPGEVVYETDSWEHPDVLFFDPPLELAAGDGLRSEVTYHNPTNETVEFGFLSTDEMAIVNGYYFSPD